MRTWIALVLLAGCSHASSSKSAQTMPVANGATCDQMAAHLVQMLPASEGAGAELGKKVAAVLQERCTADAWSAQARKCLFDVKDLKEGDTCKQYLTKAQTDAADKQMDATLGGSAGGGAPPAESAVGGDTPPPPPAKTRGGEKKKTDKRSGDPCMGGE